MFVDIFCIAGLVFLTYMFFRNFRVHDYMQWMNSRIYVLAQTKGQAWHAHARKEEAKVNYDQVLWHFWRQFDSFYDENFIKELEEEE